MNTRKNGVSDVPAENVAGTKLAEILGAAIKDADHQMSDGEPADYKWRPIEPLSDRERQIDLAATRPLYDTWRASKERLAKSSPEGLREFNERLIRRMSVETGILERLYDVDRGTTEALVTHGFLEDLIARSSTDIEPSRLIDILRDQEAAIHLVMQCVSGKRPLTVGLMHELHVSLMRHQETTTAVDQWQHS